MQRPYFAFVFAFQVRGRHGGLWVLGADQAVVSDADSLSLCLSEEQRQGGTDWFWGGVQVQKWAFGWSKRPGVGGCGWDLQYRYELRKQAIAPVKICFHSLLNAGEFINAIEDSLTDIKMVLDGQ
eukprot:1666482-Rhodomonas_salina.1